MSDERLRAAYTQSLARREPESRNGCVAPEALVALVQREGPEEERLRTLDHAMTCPACGRDLALLRAVQSSRPRAVSVGRIAGYALAASVLIAIGLTFASRARVARDAPEPMRGGDEVTLITPRAEFATLPMSLRWHSVPSATRYDITVLDPNGVRAAERTTTDTTVTLGGDSSLKSGVEYVWTVTAHLPDNGERRSTAATFRLRAP